MPTPNPTRTSKRERRDALVEIIRRRARVDLLTFLRYVWWMPRPLKVGRHTRALCDRLTKAVDAWLRGESSYIVTNMPFRHGKSDIVSRALPAFFLGRCAAQEPDAIMSGYGTSLMKGFSKKVQAIMRSEAYQQLFPGVMPNGKQANAEEWQVGGSNGTVVAQGLGGAITGKGGHLITLDDYCKNREEAESATYRDKTWESFTNDLMTRANSPAVIVVVCATRWHTDDVVGRIIENMKEDPDFPNFDFLVFPARNPKPGGWDILFPELYNDKWYRRERATLGSYAAAALLDCEPVGDVMRLFKDAWWHEYKEAPTREEMNVVVEVDPANSKKQNADFTTMWVKGFAQDGNVYVLDIIHDRLNLKERTEAVFALHRKWRPNAIAYESYGLDGDIQHIEMEQDSRHYHFPIIRLKHTMRKDSRIQRLQPWFEQGRYWFPLQIFHTRADGTVYDAIKDFREQEYNCYPAGAHDDMLDAMSDDFDEELREVCRFPETADARTLREEQKPRRNSYATEKRIFSDLW